MRFVIVVYGDKSGHLKCHSVVAFVTNVRFVMIQCNRTITCLVIKTSSWQLHRVADRCIACERWNTDTACIYVHPEIELVFMQLTAHLLRPVEC